MRPEHLDLLLAATSPSITPDGTTAVVAIGGPDLESDEYHSSVWAVATDGSGTRRITNGPSDTAPSLSPDGRWIAFLRPVDDKAQIHLVRVGGGEPWCLTDQPLGAGAPVWSPDGSRLAWTARVPEPGRYGTEDEDGHTCKPHEEPPRLISELGYRLDNLGYFRDRRPHVFVADVPVLDAAPGSAAPDLPVEVRQLTDGDADDSGPVWSPDGDAIAFVSSRHATAETDLRSAVHVVAVSAPEPVGDPPAVTGGDLGVEGVRWLPDGRLAIAAADFGETGLSFIWPTQVWLTDQAVSSATDGPVGVRALTDPTSFDLDGGGSGIVAHRGRLLVRDQRRGRVPVVSIEPDAVPGGEPEVVVDGDVVVTGVAAAHDADVIVVTAAAPDRVGDVGLIEDGGIVWLTDASARLRGDGGLSRPVDVVAATPDGGDVHGWVVLPDADEHGEGPYPVLLIIHGGPFAQYVATVFDEAQVYAGAGYAVVMCNPRGSAGYGLDHARAIVGAMGTVDADDVIAFLDHVLDADRFPLDASRVGVMGGSYGGYMTALLTTRTDRFAAAIVERGYLDPASFVGSADIGWFFPAEYHGSIADGRDQSPMHHVDRVATPTLVIHSEGDLRTPIEQGQRWFTELTLRGVRAELLVFPAESHELSRSGRPKHRRARFEHILRWWSDHLPPG